MHACKHTNKEELHHCALRVNKHMQPCRLQYENLKNRKCIVSFILNPTKNVQTDRHAHRSRNMIHFPAENDEIWNGALPLGMAVCPGLCWSSVTLSSTARKREGGEKEGKKQLTVKNKLDTLRFPFFFLLFTVEIFCMETPRDFNSFRQLNLWFGNPLKPFICMRFGNKANSHPRK